jgi:predicted transcriptional regulator
MKNTVLAILKRKPQTAGAIKSTLYAAIGAEAQEIDAALKYLVETGLVEKNNGTGCYFLTAQGIYRETAGAI